MRHFRWVVFVLALGVVVSGCVNQTRELDLGSTSDSKEPGGSGTHAVAVLIDTGIQPYHDAFRAPSGWSPPALPNVIRLGDDFRERTFQNPETWNELEPNQLYYFEGTRVFAISKFMSQQSENPYLIYDDFGAYGHGTGTASLLVQTSPNSTIVMIEAPGVLDGAWEWVLQQPWIDVVSVSQGPLAGLPDERPGPDTRAQWVEEAVSQGKLAVFAAGNEPVPKFMDGYHGNWGIIVGGALNSTRGESILASKIVDFVSNTVTDRAATKQNMSRYVRNGGTSFSAPVVAGVLAEGVYQLRLRDGDGGVREEFGPLVTGLERALTNADFRAALNATAIYWSTTDYNPLNYPYEGWQDVAATTIPVVPIVPGTPVGPWVQMGWGFVDERIIPELVAVLSGDKTLPEKPPGAVQYMQQIWDLKEEYWRIRQG